MSQMTITEALAELKTLAKRIEAKRAFVGQNLFRQEMLRDPHEKDGGSVEVVKRERQAISDLEERGVSIRRAIADANFKTNITVSGMTKSIHDWLVWRREVAPGRKEFLKKVSSAIAGVRQEMQKKGLQFATGTDNKPTDIIVHLTETAVAEELETLETILGTLDGQLSLKNATVTVDV